MFSANYRKGDTEGGYFIPVGLCIVEAVVDRTSFASFRS
jgi:hypothetical protein